MSEQEGGMDEALQTLTCSICNTIESKDVKNIVKMCTSCYNFACDRCLKKIRKKQYRIPCPFCRQHNLYDDYATIPWLREAQISMKGSLMHYIK